MKNDTTPATKSDIKSMNEKIQYLIDAVSNLYKANKDWKNEVIDSMKDSKDEITRHFDVVAEDIRHDLEGANRDEIKGLKDSKTDHEQRIVHLEKRVGIAV